MRIDVMTLYALKPRFQDLLRPWVALLTRMGVTANVVTSAATLASIFVGAAAASLAQQRWIFLVVSFWLLARMALNAVDGMLAREFHQKSVSGGYLNEIGDIASDAALYAPFALVSPFGWPGIGLVILLSMATEFAGVLGPMMGASRRYDGPMGKSDRAAVFGALGLWIGSPMPLPHWLGWVVPILGALLVLTSVNRVRAGIRESAQRGSSQC